MARAAVEQLLYLMDQAFDAADSEHSLLANIHSVTEEEWPALPEGGRRSIAAIAGHVAACKHMYDNHAFGSAAMTWADPAPGLGVSIDQAQYGGLAKDSTIEWLRDGHASLRSHIAALDDSELLAPRRTNWGEMKETRWIVAVMIEHDLYHAGEINRTRALLAGTDGWAWESEAV